MGQCSSVRGLRAHVVPALATHCVCSFISPSFTPAHPCHWPTARVPSSHRRPRPHCVGPACRCVGDKGVKVITRDGADLEVLVDHTLEYAPLSTSLGDTWHALLTPVALVPRGRYELSIGNCIDSCRWDSDGSHLVITATNGYLWCFEFQTK